MIAGMIRLIGAALTIPSTVTDGGAGGVTLIATAGAIGESGTLIAGTLTGGSTGAATSRGQRDREQFAVIGGSRPRASRLTMVPA